jgi:FHA domain-containing protein/type VI secretion system protein
MTLEVHIAGPGLDVTRRVAPGDPELVLGRDPECDVCLPDPERTVSRKHLALWNEAGELHFHVVSHVNGIEMAFGEAPPGARGVLPRGQSIKVGDYVVNATELDPPPAGTTTAEADPWAALHSEGTVPMQAAPVPAEEDPFGDWGFQTTFGPVNTMGGGAMEAGSLEAGDVSSFFQGLGIEPGTMSKAELEAMGRLVRLLVLGTLDLHSNVTGVKQELKSEDRTMVATRDNNPLKTDWPGETKLRYLFGGRLAAAGYISQERAMREVLVDLVAHNTASAAAARGAVEGTLRDLSPAALKTKLLGEGGVKLFEGARAWDAFCKWYEEQGAEMKRWVQRQLDRHYTEAYLRESVRIRREKKKQ